MACRARRPPARPPALRVANWYPPTRRGPSRGPLAEPSPRRGRAGARERRERAPRESAARERQRAPPPQRPARRRRRRVLSGARARRRARQCGRAEARRWCCRAPRRGEAHRIGAQTRERARELALEREHSGQAAEQPARLPLEPRAGAGRDACGAPSQERAPSRRSALRVSSRQASGQPTRRCVRAARLSERDEWAPRRMRQGPSCTAERARRVGAAADAPGCGQDSTRRQLRLSRLEDARLPRL